MIKRFHAIKSDAVLKGLDKIIVQTMKKYPHAAPPTLSSSTSYASNNGMFWSLTIAL